MCIRDRGVELTRKIALDDHASESALRGLYHGGAAAFDPIELDPIAVRLGQQAPRNRHPALRHRQSAVFGGVGGEFVQGEAEILRRVRLEQHSWAFDGNLRFAAVEVGTELPVSYTHLTLPT